MAIIIFVPTSIGHTSNPIQALEKPLKNSFESNAISPVGIGIKIANETGLYEVSPAIAYNSTHFEYMVVWYDDRSSNDDIWAQRLTKDGVLIGLPFTIASSAGIDRRYPRIAYNILSDQYLVVWEQHGNFGSSICGRRVASNGLFMDTNDIVFESPGEPTYSVYTPVVAYAYTSNKYLVLWYETWSSSALTSIYGQVVLGTGDFYGSRITISSDSGYRTTRAPDLAYDLLTDEYLVVWPEDGQFIDGKLVSGNGGLLTNEITI